MRLILQKLQGIVQRTDGHTADFDCIELLEPVERPWPGLFLQRGKGAHGDQLTRRAPDIGLLQLSGIQPLNALELRNHLVTAPLKVEPVHEPAPHQHTQVGTH